MYGQERRASFVDTAVKSVSSGARSSRRLRHLSPVSSTERRTVSSVVSTTPVTMFTFAPTAHVPGTPLSEWFVNFEYAAASNAWGDDAKLLHVPNYLSGDARTNYQSILESRHLETVTDGTLPAITYRDMKVRLISSTDEPHRSKWEHTLRQRSQAPMEADEDYLREMAQLCKRVDPSMSERTMVRYMMEGLWPSTIGKLQALPISTVSQLKESLQRVCDAKYMLQQSLSKAQDRPSVLVSATNAQSVTSDVQELKSEISMLIRTITPLLQQQAGVSAVHASGQTNNTNYGNSGGATNKQWRPKCFFCEKLGHVQRDCRRWLDAKARCLGEMQNSGN